MPALREGNQVIDESKVKQGIDRGRILIGCWDRTDKGHPEHGVEVLTYRIDRGTILIGWWDKDDERWHCYGANGTFIDSPDFYAALPAKPLGVKHPETIRREWVRALRPFGYALVMLAVTLVVRHYLWMFRLNGESWGSSLEIATVFACGCYFGFLKGREEAERERR